MDSPVGELRYLVKRLSLLFLSETKMRDNKVRSFMWFLGFDGCFSVSSEGKSGWLALFWVKDCPASLKHYSPDIIDVLVGNTVDTWRCTFVYGEPKMELRQKIWEQLRRFYSCTLARTVGMCRRF